MKNVSATTWLLKRGEEECSVTRWPLEEVRKVLQQTMFRTRGDRRLFSILFYLPSPHVNRRGCWLITPHTDMNQSSVTVRWNLSSNHWTVFHISVGRRKKLERKYLLSPLVLNTGSLKDFPYLISGPPGCQNIFLLLSHFTNHIVVPY